MKIKTSELIGNPLDLLDLRFSVTDKMVYDPGRHTPVRYLSEKSITGLQLLQLIEEARQHVDDINKCIEDMAAVVCGESIEKRAARLAEEDANPEPAAQGALVPTLAYLAAHGYIASITNGAIVVKDPVRDYAKRTIEHKDHLVRNYAEAIRFVNERS